MDVTAEEREALGWIRDDDERIYGIRQQLRHTLTTKDLVRVTVTNIGTSRPGGAVSYALTDRGRAVLEEKP